MREETKEQQPSQTENKRAFCLYNAEIYTGFTYIPNGFILIKDGVVENVYSQQRLSLYREQEEYEMMDMQGKIVCPGFIDTHIHGLRGFGAEEGSMESIRGMSDALPEYGVTAFSPTIAPMAEDDVRRAIEAVVEAKKVQTGAKILGIHMEGPFISRKKKGIQQEAYIRDVDLSLLQEYWELSQGQIIAMTVAPELKGMRELVLKAQSLGITLLAGHSNATYEQMVEGIEAGILHSTHFFNAMRSMHHRDPGVVGAILIHPEISCELISDGIHVHPALVRFLVKEKSAGKIVLITDSLQPTGLPDGIYTVKGDRVRRKDGVFCRVDDDTIAGSGLTMNRGVRNMIKYGTDISEAINMASLNPARVYQLDKHLGSLLPGRRADLVVCTDDIEIDCTMIDGEVVYAKEPARWNL